jgi:hypothetical protein
MQEVIAQGSRAAGIQRVGGNAWEQAALSKGTQNYTSGVANPISQQKYNQNFAPILSAIASAVQTLPPRGAPMSAENRARIDHILNAVHQAAQARKAGGVSPFGAPTFTRF